MGSQPVWAHQRQPLPTGPVLRVCLGQLAVGTPISSQAWDQTHTPVTWIECQSGQDTLPELASGFLA